MPLLSVSPKGVAHFQPHLRTMACILATGPATLCGGGFLVELPYLLEGLLQFGPLTQGPVDAPKGLHRECSGWV